MKKICLFLIVAPILFLSCKKNNDNPTCDLTVANLAGTYKLTSIRYKPAGGTESEVIGILPACKLDDLTTLKTDGNFTYQDAGVVCSPNGSYPGNWSLSGNTINLEGVPGTIEGFNCTTLVFFTMNLPNPGDKYTYRYVKQ